MFAATQGPTPDAVPLPPPDVCHVTFVTPVPPEAVPLSETVVPVWVTTAAEGDVIWIDIGAALVVGDACWRATVADSEAVLFAESNSVAVTVLAPATSVMPVAVHVPFAATPWPSRCTRMIGLPGNAQRSAAAVNSPRNRKLRGRPGRRDRIQRQAHGRCRRRRGSWSCRSHRRGLCGRRECRRGGDVPCLRGSRTRRSVECLHCANVVRRELHAPTVIRVHHITRRIGVSQSKRVTELMQSHTVDVDIAARMPVDRFVEMHIARRRFRSSACRIERCVRESRQRCQTRTNRRARRWRIRS